MEREINIKILCTYYVLCPSVNIIISFEGLNNKKYIVPSPIYSFYSFLPHCHLPKGVKTSLRFLFLLYTYF